VVNPFDYQEGVPRAKVGRSRLDISAGDVLL